MNSCLFIGSITIEEFEEVIHLLTKQQDLNIPTNQVKDIARSIDLNNDGKIDFNEFLEAFRIVDQFGKEHCSKEDYNRVTPSVNSLVSLESRTNTPRNSSSMGKKRRISIVLKEIREDVTSTSWHELTMLHKVWKYG